MCTTAWILIQSVLVDNVYVRWRTKYDLAAIQDADELITRSFVVIDFQEL